MAETNNLTIWGNFKEQFNKVFHELLGCDRELIFNSETNSIPKLKQTLTPSIQYLKVDILLGGEIEGHMALLYAVEVATSIEYLMLMGFSEKLENIEESTIDANQEFTQNLFNNVKSAVTAAGIGKLEFNIENVSIIEDTTDLDIDKYDSFVSYDWNQSSAEHEIKSTTYIIMDKISQSVLKPMNKEIKEDEKIEENPELHYQSNNETSSSSEKENVYIVQIEDCDKRKTIFKEELDNLKLILNVELKLTVRIGTKIMLLKDIVNIDIGTTLELEQLASQPLDLLINGIKIAECEVVVVEGKFGIQIVNINSKVERLSKLKFKN